MFLCNISNNDFSLALWNHLAWRLGNFVLAPCEGGRLFVQSAAEIVEANGKFSIHMDEYFLALYWDINIDDVITYLKHFTGQAFFATDYETSGSTEGK